MKTALCLYGLAGGTNDKGGLPVDFKLSYKSIKKHILDKNDCDVFIHTWGINYKKEIKELYKPKKAIFEKQLTFDKPNFIQRRTTEPLRINNIYSRWYSTKEVMKLKRTYEIDKSFDYDCVFLTRFDVSYFSDFKFNKFNLSNFYLGQGVKYCENGKEIMNKDLRRKKRDFSKLKKKYVGYPYDGRGLIDYWFFSNTVDMDRFSKIYFCLSEYFKIIRKSNPIHRRFNNRIYTNHIIVLRHFKKMGSQLVPIRELLKDFELTRRKYAEVNQ